MATTQISLRLSDDELANLKASAQAGGRTVSQEVRYRLFTDPMHQHLDAIEDARIDARRKTEEVDDWDMPIEEFSPPRPDFSKPPAKGNHPTDREDVKALSKPPRVKPMGLSKADQAKGRYDR